VSRVSKNCGLPSSGKIDCAKCHNGQPCIFDRTVTEFDGWRITDNPLAWGSQNPDVIVLGFSKGPTQAGTLSSTPHNSIAYKGGRTSLAKILHHIGLLAKPDSKLVDDLIADPNGQFHFDSLIRCTVERYDTKESEWKGTGGGMLDKFVVSQFGNDIALNCATRFLADIPKRTKLIVMLGLGTKLNYISACRELFERAKPGNWKSINQVTYSDGSVTIVHTEHFASQSLNGKELSDISGL
jgi:hypothetical protein